MKTNHVYHHCAREHTLINYADKCSSHNIMDWNIYMPFDTDTCMLLLVHSSFLMHFWGRQNLSVRVCVCVKLQALVYDILPSTLRQREGDRDRQRQRQRGNNGGRCRKAVLGVCVCVCVTIFISPVTWAATWYLPHLLNTCSVLAVAH